MGVLQRFERRLEGLVSGAFARAFKADVQPVEIASALQRELDDRVAIVSRERTMVPNVFTIELGEHDYERLASFSEPLAAELAEVVKDHAQEQRYQFTGPVEVHFERSGDLDIGIFRVRSEVVAGVVPLAGRASDKTELHSKSGGATEAWLEIRNQRHPLTKAVTVLGRGTDVDLRIDDPGVSRRHAEIRRGSRGSDQTVVVDLGSTNGTVVDGSAVREAPLGDGSRIMLGSTTVVFRLSTP